MKKIFIPFLISVMMGFISCSQDEAPEIIVDGYLGYFEAEGDLSKNDETFYFTIRELPRMYNAYTDQWHSNPLEEDKDLWFGKKVRIDPPSPADSMIQRKLIEMVEQPVKLVCLIEGFGDAVMYPEQGSIIVVSISEIDDNTRSMEIEKDESDYFNPEPPAWFFEPMSRSTYQFDGHYEVINVFVHILQTTKGTRPDLSPSKEAIRDAVINKLNQDHRINNTHFNFRAIGVDEINYIKSTFSIDDDKQCAAAMTQNNRPDALNVYVIGASAANQKAAGKAVVISNACILQPNSYSRSAVTHEVGHCLGLYHTHRITGLLWKKYNEISEKNEKNEEEEYVDGSNSDKTGDYLSDTPADPCLWPWNKYSSNSSIVDGHGDRYNPDLYNIMSYSPLQQDFTRMQVQRMHQSIFNESKLSKMASNRGIGLVGNPLGEAGHQHFTEKSRTLTFPVVADDEEVTWTIYQRSDYGYSTSHANPSVTTKKGHSITIERYGIADCYEIYATTTTPYGAERRAEWKASAGVPSPAVGTLNWTAKGGSLMGSFPGYNPTITVFHDLDLSFNYTDFANPAYRSGMTYRVYTAYGGMYETSMDVVLSDMECSGGYIDVQVVDPCCGASNSMFRINCELRWDVYSLDIKDGQLAIDVKPAPTQASTTEKVSAKRDLTIKSIKLTTPEGRQLVGRTLDTPQRKMSLSTAGMPKGQYQIEITDVEGNVHKARFGI
ncbi:MAG: hypothetical protein K2K76_08430 [Muribaculaceae bacterium]|nr:hypothetical protein [Muribaculaceae bacterium]